MSALTHAILIEGSGQEGRMAKALELLKGHFQDDPLAVVKIDNGIFEDLIILEPEEGKDITVDKIEELISLFKQKPFVSTGKACIIPHGERMNEYSQNKILKLLEEPASGDVIIILTENAQLLLPTVRSRLMRIWLGHAEPGQTVQAEELKSLTAALVYGKGTLAEANSILAKYESSREEAMMLLRSFQIFIRNYLISNTEHINAGRMRKSVLLAEKALRDIERGDRIRYALRKMAISTRIGEV